jgi:hypothetical protein
VLVAPSWVSVRTATNILVMRVDPLSGKVLVGGPICGGREFVFDSRF